MAEPVSPLGAAWIPGRHPNDDGETALALSDIMPGSIVQVAAWRGREAALRAAVKKATRLPLGDAPNAGVVGEARSAFCIAPGRYLVVDQAEGLAKSLADFVGGNTGTVTDLSHGRTALRVSGEKAEWLLAQFFAIDFALEAFPVGSGCSTAHHDVFANIQRTADDAFDVYVFRSFARSFWQALCHAADEVGYDVD